MAESEIDYLKAILKELRKLNRVMITNHEMQKSFFNSEHQNGYDNFKVK